MTDDHAAEERIEVEVGAATNPRYGERSQPWLAHRNSYNNRKWETRLGTVEQHILQLRRGSHFSELPGAAAHMARKALTR